jgi:hypothetical protein|tara:strand:+ start:17648 stop:17842 length:195 start_codon:yes stop_codon:yes gene_type:complete
MDLTNHRRDEKSNAIVSVDNSSLAAYKAARAKEKQINNVMEEVQDLRVELTEIKNMLKALVNGN